MKAKTVRNLSVIALILGLGVLLASCGSPIEEPPPAAPTASIVVPDIPHTLEGRSDCRLCHAEGIGGAPQFPVATHSERPSDVCLACHRSTEMDAMGEVLISPTDRNAFPYFDDNDGKGPSEAAHEETETETGTQPEGTTGTEEPDSATAAGEEIYKSQCSACHGANREGVAGFAPPLTAEHLSDHSTDEIKKIITEGEGSMPPFPGLSAEELDSVVALLTGNASTAPSQESPAASETEEAEAEEASEEEEVSGLPPNIPHPLEGRDNCLMCHEQGIGGAPKYPDDHVGRTSDICRACHQPS